MLTAKQEQFVQNIIQGMSQADAYRSAYNCQKMSDKTIWEKASRLLADGKVTARVAELRDQLAKPSIKTAQERMEWLTAIMDSNEETTSDKLKASDQLNRMEGLYTLNIKGDIKMKKLEDLL